MGITYLGFVIVGMFVTNSWLWLFWMCEASFACHHRRIPVHSQAAPPEGLNGALSADLAEGARAFLGATLMVAAAEIAAAGQRRAARLAPRALNHVRNRDGTHS